MAHFHRYLSLRPDGLALPLRYHFRCANHETHQHTHHQHHHLIQFYPHQQQPQQRRHLSTSTQSVPSEMKFHVTNRSHVAGRRIVSDLGLVVATSFRSRNLIIDVVTALVRVFGGETEAYSKLLSDTTEQATERLVEVAKSLGATSVVNVKFDSTSTMNRLIVGLHCSVLASGTAVIDIPEANASSNTQPDEVTDQNKT